MRINCYIRLILLMLSLILVSHQEVFAQKGKNGKKKVGLLRKGWDDVTTRNNYYFNAKKKYDELVKNHLKSRTLNYNDTLPFYFHDGVDFTSQKIVFDQIIIKTGVTLQRHDYARWKDDCYDLLGRAYYLMGNYDTALITFQYVVTNMKGKFNSNKKAVSAKEVLKAKKAKQKELNKVNAAKKKEIEKKQKEKEAALDKSAAEKEQRMEDAKKQKEKELKAKIKAKEKMLKQKKKGTYKAPTKTPASTKPAETNSKKKKNAGEVLDKVMGGVSITVGDGKADPKALKEASDKANALEAEKARLEQLSVEDSLQAKEDAKEDKLSLWEKIKHKKSRPSTLTWLAKTYIAKGDFSKAESIISYSMALRRLPAKQKKEIALVNAYFQYKAGRSKNAIEALNEAIPLIKKKSERNYYQYILAQWTEQNNPSDAIPFYIAVREKSKNEETDFYALQQIARLYAQGHHENVDTTYLEKEFTKAGKSKIYGAQAHYALAEMQLNKTDTSAAYHHLLKSIQLAGSNAEQRALTLLKWGDISFDQQDYITASARYDSAMLALPLTHPDHKTLADRSKALADLSRYAFTIQEQDSLLALSKLSKEELAEYIREQQKTENKENRKSARKGGEDATFSSQGLGSNENFDNTQDRFLEKGVWYFYNTGFKSKGFTEFKRIWGERPLQNNWRRMSANPLPGAQIATEAADNQKIDSLPKKISLKIPETDEEKKLSQQLIEEAYFGTGKVLWEKLKENQQSYSRFNAELDRFPDGQLTPQALYYLFLMLKEEGKEADAEKYARQLINHYPENEMAIKLKKFYNTQWVATEKTKQGKDEELYASIYNDFTGGNYPKVIEGRKNFSERFGNESKLMPKVAFLEALAIGKSGDTATYKQSLAILAKQYPNTEEAKKAKFYLAIAETSGKIQENKENNTSEKLPETGSAAADTIFKYKEGTHFVLVLIKEKGVNLTPVIAQLNQSLEKDFPGEKMKATSSFLDNNTPMILIKRFNSIEAGKSGIQKIEESKSQWLTTELQNSVQILLISQDNFRELFIKKNLEAYLTFYQKNYKR